MAEPLLELLTRRLVPHGLDLVHAFDPAALNTALSATGRTFRLPDGLGILFGNTRALWPKFVAARQEGRDGAVGADPLDGYIQHHLETATADLPLQLLRFSNDLTEPVLPIQFLAAEAKLADIGPLHLNIHPDYGPWFALRAAAVFSVDAAGGAASGGAAVGGSHAEPASFPCTACPRPCQNPPQLHEPASLSPRSLALLASRVACPVGRDFRYEDAQLTYHYEAAERFSREAERLPQESAQP